MSDTACVRLLTVAEVAERLGVGKTKVYELVSSRQLRSVKIDWSRRVPSNAVDEYIKTLVDEAGS